MNCIFVSCTTLHRARSLTFNSLANAIRFFSREPTITNNTNIGHFKKMGKFQTPFYLTFDLKLIIVSSSWAPSASQRNWKSSSIFRIQISGAFGFFTLSLNRNGDSIYRSYRTDSDTVFQSRPNFNIFFSIFSAGNSSVRLWGPGITYGKQRTFIGLFCGVEPK